MAKLNLVGQKFNRLTVINESGKSNTGKTKFLCVCDCGNVVDVVGSGLISGNTNSCGCYHREMSSNADKSKCRTHGLSNHPLYNIWIDIRRRCYDKRVKSYKNYGALGIKMFEYWRKNFKSFYDWAIGNGWKDGLEIDRYPNNKGNYEPTNCRMATTKENCNNKRNNVTLTVNGVTKTASQWAEETGQNRSVVSRRIKAGLSVSEALFGVGSGNKFSKNM